MGVLPGKFKGELWTAAKGFGGDARYAVGDDSPFQIHAAGTAIVVNGLHALREHDLPDAGTAESKGAGSQEAGREGNAGHIVPLEKGAKKLLKALRYVHMSAWAGILLGHFYLF